MVRSPILLFLAFLFVAFVLSTVRADEGLSKGSFDVRIRQWVSLTSLDARSGLREVCDNLSESQNVTIILERRLDPNRHITISSPIDGSIIDVLRLIAENQDAELRVIGDSLFLLTKEPAAKLKTLIALRTAELSGQKFSGGAVRFEPKHIQKMMVRRRWQWDHLARPRELVVEAVKKCHLKIENPELIPHDLWAQGELPGAQMIEFLCLVLVQYDLTFSWKSPELIVLVPLPKQVVIEQSHRIPEEKFSELSKKLLKVFPQSQWKQNRSQVLVTGPVELHEQIKSFLVKKPNAKSAQTVSWKKRRFTMRVIRKPLGEVLNYLNSAGLPIHLDKQQVEALGIDLKQLVSFETEDADANQLMEAVCGPVKLPFHITEEAIHLGVDKK